MNGFKRRVAPSQKYRATSSGIMKIFWVVVTLALVASVFADEDVNNHEDEVFPHFGPFLYQDLIKPDEDVVGNDDDVLDGVDVEDKNDEDFDMNNSDHSFVGGEIMSNDGAEEEKTETSASEVNHEAGFTGSILSEDNAAEIYEEVGEQQVATPAVPEENTETTFINQNDSGNGYFANNVEGTENTVLNEGLAEDAGGLAEGNDEVELPKDGFGTIAGPSENSHSGSESARHSGQNINPTRTPMPHSFLDMFNHMMMHKRGREGRGSDVPQADAGDGAAESHHSIQHEPHHHHHHHENPEHASE